ncbi:hypothetical protein N9D23_00505 [Rubripirellula sp.]|nr:hypothetical protein [Rubripirellula sp.]
MHPPLYSVSLRIWRELWGGSRRVATTYALFCSLMAIVFVFLALRTQANTGVAVATSLVLGLSVTQIHLSTEVRGYALLSMLTACSAWQVTRITTRGASLTRVWILGLMSLPMMLTHYFAVGICLAFCTWAWLSLVGRFRRNFFFAVFTAALIYAVIWFPFFIRDLEMSLKSSSLSFLQRTDPFWSHVIPKAFDMPIRVFVYPMNRIITVATGLVLAGFVLIGMRRFPEVRLWGWIIVFGIGFLVFMDLVRETNHISFMRYGSIVSVAVPSAFFLTLNGLRKRLILPTTVAILCCFFTQIWNPRDVGSAQMHQVATEFVPIIERYSAEYPIAACVVGKSRTGDARSDTIAQISSRPGFLPRKSIVDLRREQDSGLQSVDSQGRFWLVTFGHPPVFENGEFSPPLPESLTKEFPGLDLVDGPWTEPAGGWGISPRFRADLWLLQITDEEKSDPEDG